ncbi:MAG TPA: L-histidine N(alpha)-methyltransferase, partial [Polyangiaceae bacterium]|nr:L-histidine N(alpha)-methyltransferase [Polyangiaceae bacterium]
MPRSGGELEGEAGGEAEGEAGGEHEARGDLAADGDDALLAEVLAGLSAAPKRLPPKLFYDEEGSRLFEQICGLDEYYPTRTELGILRARAAEIAERLGPSCRLVEFGSGSSVKTHVLLDALRSPSAYVPIDISPSALEGAAAELARRYPGLPIEPLCADFTRPSTLGALSAPGPAAASAGGALSATGPAAAGAAPAGRRAARRTAVFFPGSTVGNFEP